MGKRSMTRAIEVFPEPMRGTMFKYGVIQGLVKGIAIGGAVLIGLEVLGTFSTIEWMAQKLP